MTILKNENIDINTNNDIECIIDIENIMKLIPHRYPMLLIDKIIEFEKNKKALAIKNVTINEHFFCGHFPNKPIMPGVLIIESMAQAAGVLVAASTDKNVKNQLVYLMSINDATFRKPVVPGDVMYLNVEVLRCRLNVWKIKGIAIVDGNKVADATFSAIVMKQG